MRNTSNSNSSSFSADTIHISNKLPSKCNKDNETCATSTHYSNIVDAIIAEDEVEPTDDECSVTYPSVIQVSKNLDNKNELMLC